MEEMRFDKTGKLAPIKTNTIVLFSGGIDSLAALLHALWLHKHEVVKVVYCNMRHRYYMKEIEAVEEICKILGVEYVIDDTLEGLGKWEENDANIPGRNLFLLLTAAQYLTDAQNFIYIQNVQVGETGPDRSTVFNMYATEIITVCTGKEITVTAPFNNQTKQGIVRAIIAHCESKELAIRLLKLTVGCFNSAPGHCGGCAACFRRYIALEHNSIDTQGWFHKHPLKSEVVLPGYIKRLKTGRYPQPRTNETIFVLKTKGVWPEDETTDES